MRYSLIIAGGSGTRLWPMSRATLPKQLIPVLDGKSLLQLAIDRQQGLVDLDNQFICAGSVHREIILRKVQGTASDRFYGEPMGRDTLNAVGLVCADLVRRDPDAVVAVFTADHVIQPVQEFQRIVKIGFEVAESTPNALVTFGITPSHPSTAYGYLELGDTITTPGTNAVATASAQPRKVSQFREKPDLVTASRYLTAGPDKYLWNSGMFVWRASTLMNCIQKYAPANYQSLSQLGEVWRTDQRAEVLARVYPTLPKISVDYAIMEPASRDPQVNVIAVPMQLQWLDIGSWPSFAAICPKDEAGNAFSPADAPRVLYDSRNCLVASSDPRHMIATVGCEGLIIVHTPDATLICKADRAEEIKKVHEYVGKLYGQALV